MVNLDENDDGNGDTSVRTYMCCRYLSPDPQNKPAKNRRRPRRANMSAEGAS